MLKIGILRIGFTRDPSENTGLVDFNGSIWTKTRVLNLSVDLFGVRLLLRVMH